METDLLDNNVPDAPAPTEAPRAPRLELDALHKSWGKSKSPKDLGAILDTLSGDIDHAILTAGGQPSPLTRGMARKIAIGAVKTYKPTEGTKLRSWVQTQMQRLNRDIRSSKLVIKVPEARAHEAVRVRGLASEIEAETGFEPSDQILSDKLGISMKHIASARRATTPELITTADQDPGDAEMAKASEPLVMDLVYHSVSPQDQVIMEGLFGYNNNKVIPSTSIAKKLKITPAAVSQRATRIRRMLAEAHGLV